MFFDKGISQNLSAFTSVTAEIQHHDFHHVPQTCLWWSRDAKNDSNSLSGYSKPTKSLIKEVISLTKIF